MLDLVTWTATGLTAGWSVRMLLGARREVGIAGDLVTGWLGGLLGGWLFRRAGLVGPDDALTHALIAAVGAIVLLAAIRGVGYAFSKVAPATALRPLPSVQVLEERVRRLGEIERRVLDAILSRRPGVPDPNAVFAARETAGERIADRVAQFGGSWTFIGLFAVVIVVWMALNEEAGRPFDPYPFILLNLVLSCLAALQAPVIMMSQNRQAAKDRLDAKSDYEVNIRAEMEIMSLHAKLDLLREQEWLRMVELIERQEERLDRIERRLESLSRAEDSR